MFLDSMRKRVHGQGMRIVYPEGLEERALRASVLLRDQDWAKPILLGSPDEIEKKANGLGLDLAGIMIHDPHVDPTLDDYIETYYELRKHKGITREAAQSKV